MNDLILKLLVIDQKERMDWNEYFNHPFFKSSIDNIRKQKNEINMIIEVEKYDINKEIYFLDNSDDEYWIGDKKVYHKHDNLKELNESNVDLYINNEKVKYKKYFIPKKEGLYKIKLIMKIEIKDCSFMFSGCDKIKDLNLSSFNTKNVTNMSYMFSSMYITNLNLSFFFTKNVTDMKGMFFKSWKLTNLNLSSFDTKNVTDMSLMFYDCPSIKNLDLSSFNTINVINMSYMFHCCSGLTLLNLSSFDTKKVTDMKGMFFCCEKLKNLDLSSFDTKNVTNMASMLYNCFEIVNLDLSSFNTKNVTDMSGMFFYCIKIINLDLSSFDTKNVTDMSRMFFECSGLKSIIIQKKMNNVAFELFKNNKNVKIIRF